jgi:hypothetical protein
VPLKDDEQRQIRQYLLGETSGPDRDTIEQRFILNDRYFDDVQALEDRLIADFLADRLPGHERQLFEQNFLASPRRRRKVETQRGMRDFLSEARSPGPEVVAGPAHIAEQAAAPIPVPPGHKFTWLAAAAAFLLSIGLGVHSVSLRTEITSLRDQLARRPAATAAEAPEQTMAIVLDPGIERGGSTPNTLTLPPQVGLIHLRLRLTSSNSYASYAADLELPDGTLLLRQYRLKPQTTGAAALLDLLIPSSLIPSGDYVVTLAGVTASGKFDPKPSYVFRIR